MIYKYSSQIKSEDCLKIKKDYHVFGLHNDEWEKFEKDIEYEAFLVKRK